MTSKTGVQIILGKDGSLIMIAPHEDGKGIEVPLPSGHVEAILHTVLMAQHTGSRRTVGADAAPNFYQLESPKKFLKGVRAPDEVYIDPHPTMFATWCCLLIYRKKKNVEAGQSLKTFTSKEDAEAYARKLGWKGNPEDLNQEEKNG